MKEGLIGSKDLSKGIGFTRYQNKYVELKTEE